MTVLSSDQMDGFYRPAIDKVHAKLLAMLEAAKAAEQLPHDEDSGTDEDNALLTALSQIQSILEIPDVPAWPSFDEMMAGASVTLF